MSRRRSALIAAAAGLGFTAVEVGLGLLRAHPLDPTPDLAGSALSALLLAATLAALAGAIGHRKGPGLALAAWALVWGPDAAREGRLPLALGWAPAPIIAMATHLAPPLGLALGVAGAAITPAARWQHPAPQPPRDRPKGTARSVLLVTVDTVRADAGLLPADRLGADWERYSLAIAPAPWTLPSLLSLMTGQPVSTHGGGLQTGHGFSRVLEGTPWLPSRFRALGYQTTAVICNPHLRGDFARGFDVFLHSDDSAEPLVLLHELRNRWSELRHRVPPVRRDRDARITALALRELSRPSDRPRFIWVHLLGPHEYARAPDTPPQGWTPGTTDPDLLAQAYAGNVAAARDRALALAQAADGWVVAITSDHGEAFGEDGRHGHGLALHDAELRVPLATRGLPPGAGQVALTDLGDALLAAAQGHPTALPSHPTVPVGGVRRDPSAFALREADGTYLSAQAPAHTGPARQVDAPTRRALEALGYQQAPDR